MSNPMEEETTSKTNKEEFTEDVIPQLVSLKSTSRDPRDIRVAAVISAILETLSSRKTPVSPVSIYGATLAALEGTLQSSSADSPQQPLLQILQITIPYLTSIPQFPLLSRTLRAVTLSDPTDTETKDGLGGSNAKIRLVAKTATAALKLNLNDGKQALKLFDVCILNLFEDKRPKVRKAAQACALELVMHSNQLLKTHIAEYVHAILSNCGYVDGKEGNSAKLLHLFHFLHLAIVYFDVKEINILVEDFMKLILALTTDTKFKSQHHLANAVLATLSALFETESPNDKVDALSSRILASLLQTNNGLPSIPETYSLYNKLLLESLSRLIHRDRKIANQLLPLALQASTKHCDNPDDTDTIHSITSQFSKFVRTFPWESSHTAKCSPIMEKFLHIRYKSHWDVVLPVLGVYVSKVNDERVLKALVKLHDDVRDDTSTRAVENAIGIVMEGVGIEFFMSCVELQDDEGTHTIRSNRTWILPLLKIRCTSPRHFSFFQKEILPLARKCSAKSASSTLTTFESSIERERCVELWSLFPNFCNHPEDVETTFPSLAKTLCNAVLDKRFPQLVTIICSGLVNLYGTTQDDNDDKASSILSESATKLLPSLFTAMEGLIQSNSPNQHQIQHLTSAISSLCRKAPNPFVQSLFTKVLHRLLQATEPEKVSSLLGLATALLTSQCLSQDSVSRLYRGLKPMLLTETSTQKKAYGAILAICEHYTPFASQNRNEMMELLTTGSTTTCQISSRRHRLKCLHLLIQRLDESNYLEIVPQVLSETLVCLKDSNTKTRDVAYDLLSSIYQKHPRKSQFVAILTAGLAGKTPLMRSAAVLASSRILYEFGRNEGSDESIKFLLPEWIKTVFLLFDENSREVVKSILGFVRVVIAISTKDELQSHLTEIVDGIMKYRKGLGRFRSKIKIILKKLVKLYGYDQIRPLVPECDQRLLTHMKKLDQRFQRKKMENRTAAEEGGGGEFEEMMDSDEEDSDEGRTLLTGMTGLTKFTTGMTKKSAKSLRSTIAKSDVSKKSVSSEAGPRIRNEKDGEVFDMLDTTMAKNVQFQQTSNDSDSDSDEDMEFDETGKLIIPNDEPTQHNNDDDDEEGEDDEQAENEQIKQGAKRRRVSKFESVKTAKIQAAAKKKQKKRDVTPLGAAYKSKKAGGDVKRKNQKFEPYAYVPLDARSYSKKKRGKAVAQMETVVRSGKGKRKHGQ